MTLLLISRAPLAERDFPIAGAVKSAMVLYIKE